MEGVLQTHTYHSKLTVTGPAGGSRGTEFIRAAGQRHRPEGVARHVEVRVLCRRTQGPLASAQSRRFTARVGDRHGHALR